MKPLLLCIFIACFSSVHATVLQVPAQFGTIQNALNNCATGDTVLVAPGTYYEHLNWPQTGSIKLFSSGNRTNTIIDGSKSGRVLTIDMVNPSIIDQHTIIRGFTITRGTVQLTAANLSGNGAGVSLNNASPQFNNCSFIKNYITGDFELLNMTGYGAGVYCNNADAVFNNCLFKANQSKAVNEMYGSALYAIQSTVTLTKCEITGNATKTSFPGLVKPAGVIHAVSSSIYVKRCEITENSIDDESETYASGAITIIDGYAEITNTLLRDNTHGGASEISPDGSAIYASGSDVKIMQVTSNQNGNVLGVTGSSLFMENFQGHAVTVQNSIFWNNGSSLEIFTDNSGTVSVTYSDIKSFTLYPGAGNINLKPEFISPQDDNLMLADNSPCLGTGSLTGAPSNDLVGTSRPLPAGTNPDMGCYEKDQSLKANATMTTAASCYVFPNPAHDVLLLDYTLQSDDEIGITILNTSGMVVKKITPFFQQAGNYQLPVSIHELSGGSYFMVVKMKADQVVLPFILE